MRIAGNIVMGAALITGGCSVTSDHNQNYAEYASVEEDYTLHVLDGKYRLGPRVLDISPTDLMKSEGEDFRTENGCYYVQDFVFSRGLEGTKTCQKFEIKRVNSGPTPVQTYDVFCKDSPECPKLMSEGAVFRYYLLNDNELLGFELYPDSQDRLAFVRTTPVGARID